MSSRKQRSVMPSPASVVIRIGSMPTSSQNAASPSSSSGSSSSSAAVSATDRSSAASSSVFARTAASFSAAARAAGVDLRGVDHVVDRVDDVVPALGDRLDELVPQPRALAPGERQRALVQQPERGGGVEHLGDDLQVAHVGDRAHHLDDLGQLADRPRVEVLGGDLRHADDVVALRLLRRQLGDGEVRHQRPRRVVGQVVLGLGADERGELGHGREREERVVVAEERLPLLAVLAPSRCPQRDEVALGEGELDRGRCRWPRPGRASAAVRLAPDRVPHRRELRPGAQPGQLAGRLRGRSTRFTVSAAARSRSTARSSGAPARSSPSTSACAASHGPSSATRPVSRLTTPPGTSDVASTSASSTAGNGRSCRRDHDGGAAGGEHRRQHVDQPGERRGGGREHPDHARRHRRGEVDVRARHRVDRPQHAWRSCRSSPRTRPSGRRRRRRPRPPSSG